MPLASPKLYLQDRTASPVRESATSITAVFGLVFGMLVPLIWITFPLALILGHLALVQIQKSKGALEGRGIAITSLILGYLPFIFLMADITKDIMRPGCDGGISQAQNQINSIKTAIYSFRNHHRRIPSTLEDLRSPPPAARFSRSYIDAAGIIDPWGATYQLRSPGTKSGAAFDLFSKGPDKIGDTEDDVYAN